MTTTIKEQVITAQANSLLTLIDDLVAHRVNIVTDSDWFTELVETAARKIIEETAGELL